MNSTPVGKDLSVQQRSRWSRLFLAIGVLALGWSSASAQSAVNTLAGSGSVGSADGTGVAASFQFTNPSGAAVDVSGNVYVADAANHTIRKITPAGVVTTFAGTAGASGTTDATGAAARFNGPKGVVADGVGNLFVADTNNHTIRMITSAGVVTTLAGTAGSSGSANGTGAVARFNLPFGVAADRNGSGGAAVNVFVADTQNNTIRQIVVATGATTTLAGTAGTNGSANGTGAAASFNHPDFLVSNTGGTTLYVTDRFNHIIRQVTVPGGVVTTLAGSAGTQGQNDGTGTAASFDNPTGIALDGAGNVLVADTFNHTIRSITPAGVVTTIAGLADSSGTSNGLASAARFNFPSGLAYNAGNSTAFVVDTNNQLVRRISAATAPNITGQPVANSGPVGSTRSFMVTAEGNPAVSYQWQFQPGGTGSFTNVPTSTAYTGANTATLSVVGLTLAMNGDRFQAVVSNGVGSPATSSAATLTVTQAPVFTSATTANFVVGQTTNFQVTATGSPTPTFSATGVPSWASFNTSTGVLTGNPSPGDTNATITFTATNSVSAPTQTFTAVVTTTTPPSLVGPTTQTLTAGATTANFTVSATGTPSTFTYQWERRPSGGGTFTALTNSVIDGATYSGTASPVLSISGITPTMNGDSYRVVVSNGTTTTSSVANLNVPPVITSPSTYTFVTGQSGTFNFTATGNPAPTISIAVSGTLPNGLAFNSPSLSGTPSDSFGSTTFITVSATNSGGTTQQSFTLVVSAPQAPQFTSGSSATFAVGQPGNFTVTATGAPTPTFQIFGGLPNGVSFNTTTGVISGTPTDTVGSPFTVTFQASNSVSTASQTFTLTVQGVSPTITTHPATITGNIGQNVTFTGAATGTPNPSIRWQRQPSGTVGFSNLADDGTYNGTGTNTLTVIGVTAGMSLDQFRFVASNGTTPDATSNSAQLNINLGTVISTIAGQPGFVGGADGAGAIARFNSPTHIAADSGGNIYIADTASHTIRRMNSAGTVTTIAGMAGFTGTSDGTGSEARFNSPQGVAVDGAGNIYVSDTFNHTIRMISPGGVVTTLAGVAGSSGTVDANGSTARFFGPTALAVDSSGTVFVSDSSNHSIRRMSTSRDVTTVAGLSGASGFADGTGTSARFSLPSGLALDASGNLYVADSLNQVIRRVTTGGTVTTVAGLAGNAGINDGIGVIARFNRPTGLALDNSGNVFITDTFSSTIRKLVITTSEVTTIAGLAVTTGSTDGAGSTARFNQPVGIAVDINGNIYIADTRNHTIRRSGSPIAAQIQTHPTSKVGAVGQNVTFTAVATGAPSPGYQWQRAAADSPGNFQNIFNDATYSGVNTGTLTVMAVTSVMNGDQFRVIANNGVQPVATSGAATLTVGTAPVFTSPSTATFQAGKSNSFTVASTSSTSVSYSATGLPSWATIDSGTGVLSGNPPNTDGSPVTLTLTANNGISASQTFTLFITPAEVAPVIATQPAGATLERGQTATFSVAVTGTAPFTYQWRRNGVAISGATSSTLSLPNVQPGMAGTYTVVVTNVAGPATSSPAILTVNTPPIFVSQPGAQVALAGSSVTFSVVASGSSNFNYQWRKNGVPIAGATNSTLTFSSVSAGDAGNYDVQVLNSLGLISSSLAQLTVVTAPAAPVITAQPAPRTGLIGSSVTLVVGASGAPSPSYQWRKNGAFINGANSPTLTFDSVQAADAASYDVLITNSAGSVVSASAGLRVIARSYAGTYFGSFGSGLGDFALMVRDDNTGVFLGYLPGSLAPIVSLNITVNDAGQFSFGQSAVASGSVSANADEPARAAALGAVNVIGTIASDGSITGSVQGGANTTFSATRAPDGGTTQSFAGFYQAGGTTNGATAYTIAGSNGVAFAVTQSGNASDGGRGSVNTAGQVNIVTNRSLISETISSSGNLTGTSSGAVTATLSGGSDTQVALQRLVNISSRARVGVGDQVAIAGFVIAGEQSKPVLIRAVGPTLGAAPFNVGGVLASPRLELHRLTGSVSTSLAVNAGIGVNRAAIDAAGQQAGAFPLGAAASDAAMLITLAPGNYTATVSSTTNTAGVALIEVYDLSSPAPGQKLLNIATRAAAGTGDNLLIAGFVVPPGPGKRVIIRAVGPGLAQFGVTGVVAQPTLLVFNGAQATVAQNTNFRTSPDADTIVSASASVGAFGLATNDSAVVATLAPGNYTAQVVGTGVALIEVYELP